jgi:hypothetical protein
MSDVREPEQVERDAAWTAHNFPDDVNMSGAVNAYRKIAEERGEAPGADAIRPLSKHDGEVRKENA